MTDPVHIEVRRGSLLLNQADCDRHFEGLEAVILLREGLDLLILPVRHSPAGGYLLKRRNSAGDRVVTATDFFRANGIPDESERSLFAVWDDERAALRASAIFA